MRRVEAGQRGGFTLVELLVVIAIIGTLVGLLLPAVQAAREAARRTQCGSGLRQQGIALHAYCSARGRFPAGYLADTASPARDAATRDAPPGTGWGLSIAPFMEEGTLFAAYDPVAGVAGIANREVVSRQLPMFLCASSTGPRTPFAAALADGSPHPSGVVLGRSDYVANAGHGDPWNASPPLDDWSAGANGPLYRNSRIRPADVVDGLSHTVFVGEHSQALSQKSWAGVVPGASSRVEPRYRSTPGPAATLVLSHSGPTADGGIHVPNDPAGHCDQMFSQHPSGSNVAFGDGSVRLIASDIDRQVWGAMCSIAGGETVAGDP